MTDIEVLSTPVLERLSELAGIVNAEHGATYEAAKMTVQHAIAAGDALLEARLLVPRGNWMRWCDDNLDLSFSAVNRYTRLAQFKDQILVAGGPTSLRQAAHWLSTLQVGYQSTYHVYDDRDVDEVKQLRDQGMTYRAIAEKTEINKSTVHAMINPSETKRQKHLKRMRRARAALRVQERDDAVKKIGGSAATAYAALRRVSIVIDRAIVDSDDNMFCEAMRSAQTATHKAEDEIVRALRIGRTS